MKKLSIISVMVVIAAFMFIPIVNAYPISAGDTVYFSRGTGSGSGGEFNVYKFAGPILYQTFCLEKAEYLNFGSPFYVNSISDRAINGGVGPVGDPIAFETAWLYTQFINHTLFGYTYGDNSSANALQDAIWYFEGEGGSYNAFAQLADAANPIDIGNVRVLNLKNASGGNAQDVLIVVTPEPLSLLLLGAGLIGLAGLRRKE